jgi:hypothetical protein
MAYLPVARAERETAAVQAACQAREDAARELAAAATARAERAETALDTERTERRALTDRLTAALVLAQARTRNRVPAIREKDKQPREAQLRPA